MARPQPLTLAERDYRTDLYTTAESISAPGCDTTRIIELCRSAVHRHGTRALIDLIAEWVCAVDYILPTNLDSTSAASLRDMTGVVAITSFLKDPQTAEEEMLTAAVHHSAHLVLDTGVSSHVAFRQVMAVSDAFRGHFAEWKPILQRAFQAAHRHQDRLPVRGVIRTCDPVRRKDWESLYNGAVLTAWFASPALRAAREVGRPLRPVDNDLLHTTHPGTSLLSLSSLEMHPHD